VNEKIRSLKSAVIYGANASGKSNLFYGLSFFLYGFSAGVEKVEYEYLFAVNNVREVPLFTRKNREIESTANFKEGARGRSSVRENCTFLSVCAQNNGEISARIIAYFRRIQVLSGLGNQTPVPKEYFEDPSYQKRIIDFLKSADTQIIDMNRQTARGIFL
jgi:hypothetical protein